MATARQSNYPYANTADNKQYFFSISAAIFNRNLTLIRVPFTLQGKYVSIIHGRLYIKFKSDLRRAIGD